MLPAQLFHLSASRAFTSGGLFISIAMVIIIEGFIEQYKIL